MKDVLVRFLTLQPLNEHPIIPWGLLLIWVALVGNCFASIWSQPWGLKTRLVWFFTVLLIPVVGMTVYLSVCLVMADFSFMRFVMVSPKSTKLPQTKTLRLPSKTV